MALLPDTKGLFEVELHRIGDVGFVIHAVVRGVIIKLELSINPRIQRAVHVYAIVTVDAASVAIGCRVG